MYFCKCLGFWMSFTFARSRYCLVRCNVFPVAVLNGLVTVNLFIDLMFWYRDVS